MPVAQLEMGAQHCRLRVHTCRGATSSADDPKIAPRNTPIIPSTHQYHNTMNPPPPHPHQQQHHASGFPQQSQYPPQQQQQQQQPAAAAQNQPQYPYPQQQQYNPPANQNPPQQQQYGASQQQPFGGVAQQPQQQQQQQYPQQQQQQQQQDPQQQQQISPEEKDGLRWNFNILPSNKADASKIVLPIGCLYSPLHRCEASKNDEEDKDSNSADDGSNATPTSQQQQQQQPQIPVLRYNPVVCRQCRCILNPYCRVDFRSKSWVCPLCLSGNNFPVSYSGITEQNMPAELFQDFTTIEYVLSNPAQPNQKIPPVFLYVIDTCLSQEELDYLKEGLLTSLDLLPEDAVVGLITYGTTVQLYELGYSEWTNAYVFRGDKALSLEQVQAQLGLQKQLVQGTNQSGVASKNTMEVRKRFLLPLEDVELTLTSIIEDLQPDPWPVKPNSRSRRATGVALSVATSVLESSFAHQGARIMNFVGGPCTLGDGTVVGLEHKEQLRLHNDLSKGTAKYFKNATKFYQSLTQRLVRNGHCVDVWAANLDQCGVLEMKSCCENTGGTLVLTDTFDNPVFRNSLNKFFERDADDQLKMAFNATLEVQTSADIRICGALGPVTSMNSKHRCVSDTEIGYGRTNSWKINALDPSTTVAIYFDIPSQTTSNNQSPARFFQFVTTYQHANGERRLRVTTTGVRYASQPGNLHEIGQGFDQECAAVLVSRLAVFKAESEYLFDVLRWLDRSLIHMVSRFGHYQKGNPESVDVPPNFAFFPQFMYHLRRSQFLRVFNSSPDETAFYRLHLNRVNTHDGLTMIQPSLCMFTMQNPETLHPVPLDSDSVRKDVALLMDTYFLVLIHYGEKIAYWRDENYHKDPQYENLKKLLEEPPKQAKRILHDRFPYPRYIVCDEGTSQARHLLARINPSTTHHNQYHGNAESTLVYSDDANYGTFRNHLYKIVCEESS